MNKKQAAAKKQRDENTSNEANTEPFAIVGIGASAGGLEALEEFFHHMPEDSGMAFVVIQHLDPNHTGIMPELLQRMTKMKVHQAIDGHALSINSIYIIPPNKSLSLLNGALHLFEPVQSRGLRLPIDIFFRSLAEDRGEKSIGIILSGMGSDGSIGLKAIKEKNGLVLVQKPSTAKFDAMPKSAIDAVVVDIIASAAELPGRLLSFLKLNPRANPKPELENKVKSNIDKIIILIREHMGHDFSLYKKTTLFRRIERRKAVHEIDGIQNYVRFLQENPKEIEILFKELLIGVTSFFRDTLVWDKLRDDIFPAIIKASPDDYVCRAWVPGCSTGEEAYSLAMIFKEAMQNMQLPKNLSFQIFATDIDHDAIEKARKGYFPKNISSDVSPERIEKFFTKEGDGYRISTSIREMVVFATQNVTKDPPFTKLDLLSCRNMLIYMEPELQKKLLALFNYSLNPGGIMILGSAETPGTQAERFCELDLKLKIFKCLSIHPTPELIDFPSSFRPAKTTIEEKIAPMKAVENIQSIADQILLQNYAPPSVLVNSKGDIIYITGRTGKYLEPVAGKANWNIYAMAREGLNHELPGAFRKALQNPEPVILRNLKIGTNGGTQFVDVTVQRIDKPETVKGMIMFIFTDLPDRTEEKDRGLKVGKRISSVKQAELEDDLKRAIEENQSIREEMQTSQEELKSTNEELQSTNEELQSTNEELTTSKEEMQSLNEELQTVNVELQSKVGDFLKANDDMKNLLNSTEIAALFLDKGLNIRRFTDSVADIFKIRTTDIGRPFTDLVSSLEYVGIDKDARHVLKTLITVEKSVPTNDGKWFQFRIMPYRTTDDRIDGLVITFVDVTQAKHFELALKEAGDMLRLFIQKVPAIIIGISYDGKILEFNPKAEKVLGYQSELVLGKSYVDMFVPKTLRKNALIELKNILKSPLPGSFQSHVISASGVQLSIKWSVHKLYNERGEPKGIITVGEQSEEEG